MPLPELLFTILITSLFCCGLSVASSEGMVLYFLRGWLDTVEDNIGILRNKVQVHPEDKEMKFALKFAERLHYCFKPLILCTACMGSFWGIVIFIVLHGFNAHLMPLMAVSCLCSCFLNAFLMAKYNGI